ncbi:putative 5'-nucleotidase precursor [Triangularia verruculosa]|uniref:5'-nucleotidase n=1 Tax=Triangularia verruculosa TaxID=2587418 RepID=A0AAN6X758_9PEZI|nr:putative 5'-nucleotidase precursor [Triangularia verruculosa]
MGAAHIPTAEPTITFASGRDLVHDPPDVRILHFNDVYHLDSSSAEPAGGVSRFMTVVNEYRSPSQPNLPNLVPLFSGDVFNPSLESSITKGSHMVPILNNIGTLASYVGNHDLDFKVRQFRHLSSKCHFPWLLANVLDPELGEGVPIGNAKKTHIITTLNGIKIGLIGLEERDEVARELIPELKEQSADVIIALTYQREPNDNQLARNLGGGMINIILSGHNHFYAHSYINGTYDVNIVRRDIIRAIRKDPETEKLVHGLTAKLKKSLEKPVGWTAEPLDARFTTVRTRESNIGNWVYNIIRGYYGADCALIAAGTIKGDQIYAPGPIREALENGVSLYPALEGRFPIYVLATRGYIARSKDRYKALLIQSEGGDCKEVVIEENGILISAMLRQYFMALTVIEKWGGWGPSLARHWDKVLQEASSSCSILPASPTDTNQPGDKRKRSDTANSWKGAWEDFTPAKLRERKCSVSPLVGHAEDDSSDESTDEDARRTDVENCDRELRVMRKFFRKWCRLVGVDDGKDCAEGLKDGEGEVSWTRAIRPKVEGRIVMVSSRA